MQYKNIFTSGNIASLVLKNRIIMSPMSTEFASDNGEPGDRLVRYYRERAEGGVGMIITEFINVDEFTGCAVPNQLSLANDSNLESFKNFVDTLHKAGAKVIGQMNHAGPVGIPTIQKSGEIVAPSEMKTNSGVIARALTTEECEEIALRFADTAERLQKAGFDGVEIHGAHGYLISSFLTPFKNKRSDKYGGSIENRARLGCEIIEGIRERCGKDFVVSIRMNGDDFIENGMDHESAKKTARLFEEAGADVINVSNSIAGSYKRGIEPISYEEGWKSFLAKGIKDAVNIPVIAVNNVKSPAVAEKLLEDHVSDFVILGRALIADPEFVVKTAEGREDEIVQCMSCLNCIESEYHGRKLSCAANPVCGREQKYDDFKVDGDGRKVVVVGSGPAGLEAARTLSKRGFAPVLFESRDAIGGSVRLGSRPPLKDKLRKYIEFYGRELKRLNVEVRLGERASADKINELEPYAVFHAAGGNPLVPSIPGIDNENVYTSIDILEGTVSFAGQSVAVIGSGMTGLETAEYLAGRGNRVTVIEMQDSIGPDVFPFNLIDILPRLHISGVELLPKNKLISIDSASISVEAMDTGIIRKISTDKVVLSLGVKPNTMLMDALNDSGFNIVNIGDSQSIGRIANATYAGYDAAYSL